MLRQSTRLAARMSTMARITSAPFTQAVVSAMRNIYPEELADKSFDNTGLLLEAPFNPVREQKHIAMLAIDLTRAVCDEAIESKVSIVIPYHPIIFSGLKSLTFANSQQQSLLRLAAEGISVYSPHTAVDAAEGGNADWLADVVTNDARSIWLGLASPKYPATLRPTTNVVAPEPTTREHSEAAIYRRPVWPKSNRIPTFENQVIPHTREVITPTKLDNKLGSTGMGRVIRFSQSVPLHDLIENIGQRTGEPASIAVATPQGSEYSALVINKVAVCAGSGGGVFRGLKEKVDLLVTGEMSHHEVLAAIEQGTCVVCLGHSDSERLYLREVMVAKLKQALKEVGWGGGGDETWEVMVSNRDRDPFGRAVRVK